jgi:hypothetical protein
MYANDSFVENSGMELNREYESWKHTLIHNLVAPLEVREMTQQKKHTRDKLKQALSHTIDRLLYTATFSTLKQGDVYNPGAFRQIPDIFVINSYFDETVGSLSLGEAFRLAEDRTEMYEVLAKTPFQIVARNVEGELTIQCTNVSRFANITLTKSCFRIYHDHEQADSRTTREQFDSRSLWQC